MSDSRPRMSMKIVVDDPKAAARAKVRDETLANVIAAARRGDLNPDVVEACIGGVNTVAKSAKSVALTRLHHGCGGQFAFASGADRARCSWCATSQFRD